ncbi:MAG: sodium:calcium antiporter [Planctomycetes bacterium]|nr:sodium:calcium antiporter [Planctomycetota bacterium]
MIPADWPFWAHVLLFVAAAAAIALAGSRMAGLADRLADRTGLGEAVTGTLFLGLITALPGITASVTAALQGRPGMAVSNAMGGIAIQTAFLAIADIFYTRANLEHAAASAANMLQTTILIGLMTLVLLAMAGPEATVFHVHPATPLLFIAAGYGVYLVYRSSGSPMWRPRQTPETVEDVPAPESHHESLSKLILGLVLTAIVVLAAGVAAADAAGHIADATGVSESVMGGLGLAFATSLPELVTTIAAVRRGALTLAVSDIVGGNLFDVLFVCMADLAWLEGSLYHAKGVTAREMFLTGLTILLNVILLTGLIYRQKRGPGNIGFESLLILIFYVGGFLIVSLAMS